MDPRPPVDGGAQPLRLGEWRRAPARWERLEAGSDEQIEWSRAGSRPAATRSRPPRCGLFAYPAGVGVAA